MLKKSILFSLMLIFLAACGDGQKKEEKEAEISETEKIEIENYWMRPAAKSGNTAVYADVVNNSSKPDTLVGVATKLSNVAQVHETFKKENDVMGMRHIDFVEIGSNSTLQLKPGGYHLMLIKLKQDLMVGDKGKVTLVFKRAGKITIEPEVKEAGKMQM
jgi:hypothetical protein